MINGVHPRVGGETQLVKLGLDAPHGPSPRGGETTNAAFASVLRSGPSPRGRGNPLSVASRVESVRSIPAWAGKPRGLPCDRREKLVHPRVGGKPQMTSRRSGSAKVHPRVGGETGPNGGPILWMMGPSPRGRGNQEAGQGAGHPRRSIPAWAGKPVQRNRRPVIVRVHPRVGGETAGFAIGARVPRGPSPRGRGNLERTPVTRPPRGSIPAWAGKPRPAARSGCPEEVHPRVGRGNQERGGGGWDGHRSIPAWAGKPGGRP